jgi:hypothetical protein
MGIPARLHCPFGYAGNIAAGAQVQLTSAPDYTWIRRETRVSVLSVLRSALRGMGYVRANTHECSPGNLAHVLSPCTCR